MSQQHAPGSIAPRTVVPGYGIYPLPVDVDLVAAALLEVDLLSVMFAESTIIGTRTYQRSDIEAAVELTTADWTRAAESAKSSRGARRPLPSTACGAVKG